MVLAAANKAHVHALLVSLKEALLATGSTSTPTDPFKCFLHSPTSRVPPIRGPAKSGGAWIDVVTPTGKLAGETRKKDTTAPSPSWTPPPVDHVFEATPHRTIEDPVVVYLCNLKTSVCVDTYQEAIKKIVGETSDIRRDRIAGGVLSHVHAEGHITKIVWHPLCDELNGC